jgi:hypothetical protein
MKAALTDKYNYLMEIWCQILISDLFINLLELGSGQDITLTIY